MYILGSIVGDQIKGESKSMAAVVDAEKCSGCGDCANACPSEAIKVEDNKAVVIEENCLDCAACVDACPNEAITVP